MPRPELTSSRARGLASIGFHAAVSLVLTFPLVLHLGSSIPGGIEDVRTVPLFNLWTLRWNFISLQHHYDGYWNAPIFHPTLGTFALSEPQPLTGLAFSPIAWVLGATVGYNLVLLGIFTMNGVAASRLARQLGAAWWPATLAGVLGQALPFVMNELGVLQLTVVFPIFFLVSSVLQWSRRGTWLDGIGIGAWLTVIFLTSSYFGLFTILVVPIAGLTLLDRRLLTRRRLVGLAAGAALFAVTALPIALAQKSLTDPYTRSDTLIDEQSAQPVDYVHLDPSRTGITPLPFLRTGGGSGHALYPGTILAVFALAGAVLAYTRRRRRREVTFLLVGAGVAVLLSFGGHLGIGSWNAYAFIQHHMPGYESLRSPFRFAALAQVLLVPVAAIGLDALWQRRDDAGPLIASFAVLMFVFEVAFPSQTLYDVPPADPAWVGYLDAQPGDDAVAMVPFPTSGDVEAYEPTTVWMLDLVEHRPIVNGYSGLFPPQSDALTAAMAGFPDPPSIAGLRDRGVRWVVATRDWLNPTKAREVEEFPELHEQHRDADVVVYRLD
jgi:hypothetical protein